MTVLKLAVDNGSAPAVAERRRKLLGAVHVAKKALAIDTDDYRALVERVTGHRSAADCTDRQLRALVAEFERMGFRGGSPSRSRASSPVAGKARAMWISLYQLAAIDDPAEAALEAFARRQLGVDRLQWADERQGFRLIEALKAMADRHGWDQRTPPRMSSRDRVRLLKDRLVGAQLAQLAEAGATPAGPIAANRDAWSDKQLESAARHLADLLRAVDAG